MSSTIKNPGIPSSILIPEGMFPGRIVRVKGSTPLAARRFGIDFQYNNDIAFHFNPRFTNGYIVRNHYISGLWGNEETSGGLPLTRGSSFEIVFVCHYNRFKVMLNGEHFTDFIHRVPYHRITHITVGQDIIIDEIDFEGTPPPTDYLVLTE
ncbi:galectin-9-like isoform X2 [Spodoptera litura]|uniref:Galectin n=1 Tax=Spodoptera litura TaxID=69820 RepID=A0A9J7DV21_SPOLT|nr:galectin-9-like isoform X2 [Spodoptera litura]